MPKSKDRDFFVNARRVVELAIGEQMDGKPLPDPNAGKNPAAFIQPFALRPLWKRGWPTTSGALLNC
jgi:hypothetical protein